MLAKVSTFIGPNSVFSTTTGTPSLVLSLDATGYTGSGTWSDLSNLNNDATPNGSISWSSEGGGSFEFNGIDSYFGFSYPVAIPLGESKYTIETWFKSDSYAPGEQGSIVGWGSDNNPSYSNVLRLDGNGLINYWWADDIEVYFSGTSSLYTENWYYVVATYDGTNRRLYLNGNLVAIDTPSAPHLVNDMTTLKVGFFFVNYFNGKISKLKIHSKAISDAKVLSNFNSDKVRHGYEFGSLTFSSSESSYISNTSAQYAIGTNDFTLEAFVNPATFSDYSGIVSLRDGTETGLAINVNQYGNIRFMVQGSYHDSATMSTDNWYHVAMSRISGTTSCYINGEFVHQFTDTNNYTNEDLVVGRYYLNQNDFYFDGSISNVRLITGTALYSGQDSFSVPSTPLNWTSGTKYLLISQKTSPTTDTSGIFPSTTANNVGWTSSLPVLDISYFNYPDFSNTSGLNLLQYNSIVSNQIRLTALVNSQVGNIWTSTATNYNRNFSLEWNFECSGGSGADGFCIQWLGNNSTTGGAGGDVGSVNASIVIFQFKTYSNNFIRQYQNGSSIASQANTMTFRQNLYYWFDYDFASSTAYISYATSNVKPVSPIHTFTSVTFDSSNYYFGFGAANGGSNDYHTLKSMKLTFN